MSFLPDVSTALISQFQGSLNGVDSYDIDPGHGLWSQNNDFILGPSPSVASNGQPSVQVATRRGTSQVAQIPSGDGAITTIYSWYSSYNGFPSCFVAMYSAASGVRFWQQPANSFSAIIMPVTGAAGAVFVSSGARIYAAFYDSTGRRGISQGYVFGLEVGVIPVGDPAVDQLFSPPLTTSVATVTPTQPGAGAITAGTHNLGYVFITRNGDAAQVLNPVSGSGVFAPVSFTAADGVHNLQVVIDFLSVPTYLQPFAAPVTPTVQLVMSSAANLNEYYLIPGAVGNIPTSPGSVTITCSITDGNLTATGTNVTQNQNQLTSLTVNPVTGQPFSPSAIFSYSSRLGYVGIDAAGFPVVYFSDQNNYQSLNAAYYGIYLEGTQVPVQGASLGGICYIASLSALYATQDNGGLPGTWTPPQRIDGSVGVLSPTCLLAAGGKLVLASEKGLYIYRGGSFPTIPVSFWQSPDWSRINWLQPTQVQVVDDALDHVIRVLAPLNVVITGASNTSPITITTAILINGAPVAYPHLFQTGLSVTIGAVGGNTAANGTFPITVTGANTFTIPAAGNGTYTSGGIATPNTPNAVMSWDYTAGDSPGGLFYSLHALASFMPSSIGIIRNLANNYDEVWMAASGSAPGNLIRRVLSTNPTPYRDVDMQGNPAAINCPYETSLVPGVQDQSNTLHDFTGAHVRVRGSGGLNLTCYSLDHNPQLTVIPAASPVSLNQSPGLELLIRWALRNEQQSLAFGTNAVDAYFVMALLRFYYTNSLPQR